MFMVQMFEWLIVKLWLWTALSPFFASDGVFLILCLKYFVVEANLYVFLPPPYDDDVVIGAPAPTTPN